MPVICFNASTLQENVTTAAALHEPTDVKSLSNRLMQGVEDDTWRQTARKTGLNQAAQFSRK